MSNIILYYIYIYIRCMFCFDKTTVIALLIPWSFYKKNENKKKTLGCVVISANENNMM